MAAYKQYEDVHKMALLDFLKEDVTWVTSKLSGFAGALGVEVIDLHN